jgi:hypothetical protein
MRTLVLILFACSSAQLAFGATAIVGSRDTGRIISSQSGQTTGLRLGAVELPASGGEFQVTINGRAYTARDFRIAEVKSQPASVLVNLTNTDLDLTVEYLQADTGAIRKLLRLRPKHEISLERVDVELLKIPEATGETARSESEQKGTEGFPICAFLEARGYGAFFSLDFAYSEIQWTGNLLSIGYQPFVKLKAGEQYESHAVTFQAYRLTGKKQGAYDSAAAEAFRRYIRFDYARPHLNGPQFFYTSIVNRFTEVDKTVPPAKEGEKPIRNTIFYTLSDANYYMLHPEKIPEEIDFCKSLSMDVCQLYEGPFEWIPGNPAASLAKRIGEYARNRGVKLGLYTGANQLTAPHFNHYAQDKGRPEWKLLTADGKREAYCWGSPEFKKWFTDVLIETSINFNFQDANFDFLKIAPCFDPKHGHAIGEKGIYRQVLNLVSSLDTVRAAVPGYVYDSNLGWPPFVPKIARSMDAFYLTDPHFTTYFPSLNATEQLDNSRRFQMVSYFLNHLTPVEYFRNCEYFVVPDSVIPDSKIFEFGILQGLALTPNLQLGEARALFDRFSPAQQEDARRFLARWTSFVRQNFELYANTLILSGMPKLGQVEIYAHATEDRSVVFLVNPNPFPAEASFAVNESIGLSGAGPFLIHELYPEDRLLNLAASKSEHFAISVPSRTVRVFEIGREPGYSTRPLRITGAPASYDRFANHYRITLEGNQGDSRAIGLYLPDGERLTKVESNGQALQTHRAPGGYSLAVLFPKEKVEEQVQNWVVRPASLEQGTAEQLWKAAAADDSLRFPQLASSAPVANFLGARIENLLNERYSRELLVYFEPGKIPESDTGVAPPVEANPPPPNLQSAGNSWWYTARFPVAYVQGFIPPAPNDHNYISLNFAKPGEVSVVKAWLNGKEVPVEIFQYWRGPAWAKNYYIDGTKHGLKRGENTVALFVKYETSAP